ncbi:hypothetical protein FRC09_012501 [Ceratobasidium sp. 395]|nr:hypothetical protein FRC09_012501 [Ceratobasidium sp. 395]
MSGESKSSEHTQQPLPAFAAQAHQIGATGPSAATGSKRPASNHSLGVVTRACKKQRSARSSESKGKKQAEPSSDSDADLPNVPERPERPDCVSQSEAIQDVLESNASQLDNNFYGGDLMPDPEDVRLAEAVRQYRLGGAYIHAFGIGHVDGVVNPEQDPNARANPRPLRREHVSRLSRIFSRPGEKRDHYTPIFIMAPMPLFKLINPLAHDIAELEKACLTLRRGDRWIEEAELAEIQTRLHTLHESSPKATLLNGNHRIQAIKHIGDTAYNRYRIAHFKLRNQQMTPEDAREQMNIVTRETRVANYRVEVYNSEEIPDELVNYLVRNEGTRLAKGFENGEKTWWMANRFEANTRRALDKGIHDRSAQYDFAHQEWLADVEQVPDPEGESERVRPPGHQRGDGLGEEPTARLYLEPLTTRMVLDTKNALVVYDKIFKNSHAIAMLKSAGALLTCRFWMSIRVLLNVFDVALGQGFEEAEEFVGENPGIQANGYEEAVLHWDRLHSTPQERLPYLDYYTDKFYKKFDTLYVGALSSLRKKHPTRNLLWDRDDHSIPIRRVFDELGQWAVAQSKPGQLIMRRIGTSLRVYARLPIYCESLCGGPYFYGCSALSATRWMDDIMEDQHKFKTDAGLHLLEYLIDKFLPIWTIGAQSCGKAANNANWYQRSRGLQQIAMRLLDNPEKSIEAQLSDAVMLLSDTRLPIAMEAAQTICGSRIKELIKGSCVWKKSNNRYPVLEKLCRRDQNHYGDLVSEIGSVRTSIQAIDSKASPRKVEDLKLLISQHPEVEAVIGINFFQNFPIFDWLGGWNCAPSRGAQNIGSLIGWAIFTEQLEQLVEDCMGSSPELLFLANLAELLFYDSTGRVWWQNLSIDPMRCIDPPFTPPSSPKPMPLNSSQAHLQTTPEVDDPSGDYTLTKVQKLSRTRKTPATNPSLIDNSSGPHPTPPLSPPMGPSESVLTKSPESTSIKCEDLQDAEGGKTLESTAW